MTPPVTRAVTTHGRLAWITLILLAAAVLRLVDLPTTRDTIGSPPGMTHDEADHGLTAWEIVSGRRGLYFTVGYGREPLYDYATALVMAGTGPTLLAARLTSVYFSLLLLASVFAWTRRAFGGPVALLTAAGLAAGFWPLMAARQALRSIALPGLFAPAVLCYWRGSAGGRTAGLRSFVAAGLLLGLTFYTYIPARVLWLALPALTLYLAFTGLPTATGVRRRFDGPALTLVVAAVAAAPLFFYLAANPGLEVRIDELSAPLRAAAAGDFGLLWANARGALRLFTIEGDQTWRYNLPGQPWLGPVMGALFYMGLAVAAWLAFAGRREKLGFSSASRPGAFLALVWLGLGIAPVLVTGPGLSTTQAIGALPVLYLFPALALVAGYRALEAFIARRAPRAGDPFALGGWALAVILFAALAAMTARDYFGRWADAPEVRVQYETTMISLLNELDARGGAAAVSTITPGPFHSPAVALLTLRNPSVRARWFDGRQSLLLPDAPDSILAIPGFTPLPAALQPYLAGARLVDELPMRRTDLDRPVQIYALDGPVVTDRALASMATVTASGRPLPVRFGEYLELLAYDLPVRAARPGETVTLVTAWRLLRPLPGAALFAHLDGGAGLLAQADALGAPGELWHAGDVLLQLHQIALPPDAPAGTYSLSVGAYTAPDGPRLTVPGLADGRLVLTELAVSNTSGAAGEDT